VRTSWLGGGGRRRQAGGVRQDLILLGRLLKEILQDEGVVNAKKIKRRGREKNFIEYMGLSLGLWGGKRVLKSSVVRIRWSIKEEARS